MEKIIHFRIYFFCILNNLQWFNLLSELVTDNFLLSIRHISYFFQKLYHIFLNFITKSFILIHFSYLNGNLLFNLTVFPSKHHLSTSIFCISPKSIPYPFPPILIQETPLFYPCNCYILYNFFKFCLIQQNLPHFMYHILLNKTSYTKETTHE